MKNSHNLARAGLAALMAAIPGVAQDDDEVFTLSPFEVSAGPEQTYAARTVISATLTEQSIEDVPMTINVVTGQMVDDLNLFSQDDVYRFTPGLTPGSTGGTGNNAISRGFGAENLRNGLSTGPNFQGGLYNLGRIEASKGPQGVLYGVGGGGGVVNFLTKRPLSERQSKIVLEGGTLDQGRASLDLTGPIATSGWGAENVAYRVIADYREIGSDQRFAGDSRLTFAPGLRVQLTSKLSGYVEYEYFERDRTSYQSPIRDPAPDPDQGEIYYLDQLGLGWEFSVVGSNAFNISRNETVYTEWNFSPTDTTVINLAAHRYDGESENVEFRDSERFLKGQSVRLLDRVRAYNAEAVRLSVKQDFNLGDTRHAIIAGVTNSTDWSRDRLAFNSLSSDVATWDSLEQSNYTITDEMIAQNLAVNTRSPSGGETTQTVYRIVDSITALDGRLNAILGYSVTDFETQDIFDPTDRLEDSDSSYQIGAVYDFSDSLGLYANYSTVFNPNGPALNEQMETEIFPPEEGSGYDVGVKFLSNSELGLSGSVAYFVQERSNILRRVQFPDNIGGSFFRSSGEEKSDGFEVDLTYYPSDNFELRFMGTFFDGRVVSDEQTPENVGLDLEDVAEESFTFFTRYTVDTGSLANWSFGGSVFWTEGFPTDVRFSRRNARTSEYTLVNAYVEIPLATSDDYHSTLSFYLDNVLNEEPYMTRQAAYGEPFRARAQIRMEF